MIDLSGLIDRFLEREERPRRVGVYWPSEIGYCLRQVYYRYVMPKAWPKDKLRIFKSANQGHRFISAVLAHSENIKLVASEKEFSLVYGDFEISGRIDDLIWIESERLVPWLESRLIPVEVKTISGRWTKMNQLTLRREHVYQLHPYLKATRTPAGVIWYLTRDSFGDKSFTVRYDQRTMDEVVSRARTLHEHLIANRAPEPEAKKEPETGWMCQYCQFLDECNLDLEVKE